MNYTTLTQVKRALGANETTDDTMLSEKIAEASRVIDTTICKAPKDYFMLENVEDELLKGFINQDGAILCWPKKAIVNSVAKFEYRLSPRNDWLTVDAAAVTISNNRQVTAWGVVSRSVPCFVRLNYSGGYGTEEWTIGENPVATITGLPADINNAATVLAVRFYKEEKSGLTDAIGVAELGELVYTKAIPVRVERMCEPYRRTVA